MISAPCGAGALDLQRRRVGRHDDDRGDAEPLRGDRHALGMIAGGEGDHAALPLLVAELHQPVGRAAQLERAAGLQAFAFQPDAGPANPRLDQRRSLNRAADSLGRGEHVITRDLWTTFQAARLLGFSTNRFVRRD